MSCQILSTRSNYIFFAILVLSGFTHLWNAAGFPSVFFDEGIYMRRAMHVLAGLGPQEAYFHDHPFFGQIFLASMLALVGFPNSLHPSAVPDSISNLYLVPRVIMGLFAIADTFLIYKIAEKRYGINVALLASMFFAVMPMTWLVRRILLDSILLPFLLMSILLAVNSKNSNHKSSMVLLSGICMGLAIFTKIPAFAMMPLVAGLVYFGHGKNIKHVAIWLIPVILIPLIWPLQSVEAGQFNIWVGDVLGQSQRHSWGLPYISMTFFQFDPVLFILGLLGISFCIFRKDNFMLFWFVPFILFLFAIGYNQYFYWIPVLPVFCISASILVTKVFDLIKRKKMNKNLPILMVLGLGIFGFVSTTMLITTNMTSSEFQAASFVLQHVKDTDNKTTILASPAYSWIFNCVFHKQNVFPDYTLVAWQPVETQKTLTIVDLHYFIDTNGRNQLSQLYNDSRDIAIFHGDVEKYDISLYPYTNLKVNYEGSHIEIREKS